LIAPIFRKHAADIGKVFGDAAPKELQMLESVLRRAGKRAEALAAEKKSSEILENASFHTAGVSLFAT
jgi:hypothetical protein